MKPITYNDISIKGLVLCTLFGHKFKTVKNITNHFKEFECSVCRREATNDAMGRRISLTPEHREINEVLITLFQKRSSHEQVLKVQ